MWKKLCNWEKGKYLASIIDESMIMCDEIIESYNEDVEGKSYNETKTIITNFNEKKAICKTQKGLHFTCIFNNYYSIIDSC